MTQNNGAGKQLFLSSVQKRFPVNVCCGQSRWFRHYL